MASDSSKPHIGEPVTGYPATAAVAAAAAPCAPAYPYAAPSYVHSNPDYVASRAYHGRFAPSVGHGLCRRFLVAITVAFFLVITFSVVLWIVIRPRAPVFSVSSAAISGFNLSGQSDDHPQLSSSFKISISVFNPNKKTAISYNQVMAAVAYGGYVLAETTLPPFYQEKGNLTTLPATMVAADVYVSSGSAKRILGDRANGNAVGFQVMMEGWALYRTKVWTTRSWMRVYCGDVRVAFANKTAAVGSIVESSSLSDLTIMEDSTKMWDEGAGYVLLYVRVDGRLRWKVGTWVSGHYHIEVNCPALFAGDTGKLRGGDGAPPYLGFQQFTSCNVDV
ncbi:hypothetical protein Cni_G26513 [Canna indica]|uniref:Late embryogenesis abundant protein LEA-2 subgroup domain-containing protein n=1 Tax=Canna indica TaxID=4628 RepID=A0AAQ3KZW2_9LILI|nr:hypothetical protein Cni_G26513 [Canna indica]